MESCPERAERGALIGEEGGGGEGGTETHFSMMGFSGGFSRSSSSW